jgi:hypothetical protein
MFYFLLNFLAHINGQVDAFSDVTNEWLDVAIHGHADGRVKNGLNWYGNLQ